MQDDSNAPQGGQENDEIVLIPASTVTQDVLDKIAAMSPRLAEVVDQLHACAVDMGPIIEWESTFARGRDLDDEIEDAIRSTGYYTVRDLWDRVEDIARGAIGSRSDGAKLPWLDAKWAAVDDEVMAKDPEQAPNEFAADQLRRQQERIRTSRELASRTD